jgi:hypothetical protein
MKLGIVSLMISTNNCNKNIKRCNSLIENPYLFEDKKFDIIFTNPPFGTKSNYKQLEKILHILNHILQRHNNRYNNLYCGIIWDEADKTYSLLRDKEIRIKGISRCIRNFTLDDTTILHGNGFITATEGGLIDGDYPECVSAHAVISEINPEDENYYRAFHHPDSIINRIKFKN